MRNAKIATEKERQNTLFVETVPGKVKIIRVSGELDFYNRQKLAKIIDEVYSAKKPHFVLDLSGLIFLDSSGLGLIILTQRKINERQGMMAVIPSPPVKRMIELMRLEQIFMLFSRAEDAAATILERSE